MKTDSESRETAAKTLTNPTETTISPNDDPNFPVVQSSCGFGQPRLKAPDVFDWLYLGTFEHAGTRNIELYGHFIRARRRRRRFEAAVLG